MALVYLFVINCNHHHRNNSLIITNDSMSKCIIKTRRQRQSLFTYGNTCVWFNLIATEVQRRKEGKNQNRTFSEYIALCREKHFRYTTALVNTLVPYTLSDIYIYIYIYIYIIYISALQLFEIYIGL